jgi:hypothetical protein
MDGPSYLFRFGRKREATSKTAAATAAPNAPRSTQVATASTPNTQPAAATTAKTNPIAIAAQRNLVPKIR